MAMVLLVPLIGILYYPDYGLTVQSIASFTAAGTVGSICGLLLFYTSIERVGASRATPIVALNALIATVLAILFLGESLTVMHGIGVVLVISGIIVIARETSERHQENLPRRELVIGLSYPFGAAFAFGLEPIFANFGFAAGTPPLVGIAIKTTIAWLGFSLFLWWRGNPPTRLSIPGDSMRWIVFAGFGYIIFLITYYFGLEIAPVNVVSPIIITNVLFVVALSAVVMPRRLELVTPKLAVMSTIVVVGAIMVTFYG